MQFFFAIKLLLTIDLYIYYKKLSLHFYERIPGEIYTFMSEF